MILCHFSGKPSTTRLNVVNRRSTPEGAKVNESIKSKEKREKSKVMKGILRVAQDDSIMILCHSERSEESIKRKEKRAKL